MGIIELTVMDSDAATASSIDGQQVVMQESVNGLIPLWDESRELVGDPVNIILQGVFRTFFTWKKGDMKMEAQLKETTFFGRLGPGFMGGALLAMLVAVNPIHAGWLVEDQELTASDAAAGDAFGDSVAVSGNTAVVGASFSNDAGGINSGSAYVFVRNGSTWSQQAKLTASDVTADDLFGRSVAVSGDTVVVGAYRDDDGGVDSGSAYVFVRSGNTWSQQAKLTASDGAADDLFGRSVAVSGDTVVVGSYLDDDGGVNSGSAYVFDRNGTTWNEQSKLTASDAAERNWFGVSVAFSGDTVVVGASLQSYYREGTGSAYVFVRNGTGWVEQAKLSGSDADWTDYFGRSVAVFGDTALVGAPVVEGGGGSVYVFVRNGATWSQETKLTAPTVGARFGTSVSIFGDTAVVGYPFEGQDMGNPGATAIGSAYVFKRSGSAWNQEAKLMASGLANRRDDGFGVSVAIFEDTLFVGAPRSINVSGTNSGSAYIFELACDATYSLPGNQWRQISLPCDPGANNTVAAVFGDNIPGTYGTDWILYRYDASGYVALTATAPLSQGVGYWIIQKSGDEATLDMPDNSTPTPIASISGCLDTAKGCFEIPLATQENEVQWNMIGYPFVSSASLGNARVQTDSDICAAGCDLDTDQSQGIIHNQLWAYNGTNYDVVNTSGNLEPWGAYWLAALQNADGLSSRLLLPKP
jgi:predicted amidohydrolase